MMKSFEIIVGGLVQGVGYRNFAVRKAAELDLKGYVKNLYDGTVKIVVTGNENLLNIFIDCLKIGPRRSSVKFVKCREIASEKDYEGFHIEF